MLTTCGVFLYSTAKSKILVCHATNSRWTQWSIPKGLSSEGEDLLLAASRELKEETEIDMEKLLDKRITRLPPVKYKKQNKMLESFLVITDDDFDAHKFKSNLADGHDFAEIDSWKWVTLDQAEKMLHESQSQNLVNIRDLITGVGN
jgi:8-oxo-dGTP pyrophosphatase MutT (NUDIX family)